MCTTTNTSNVITVKTLAVEITTLLDDLGTVTVNRKLATQKIAYIKHTSYIHIATINIFYIASTA